MDTMWLVVKWGGSGLVALLIFLWFVLPILKKWRPTWFGPVTTAATDTVTAWVDQIAFLTALAPAYLLARKRGDTIILDFLSKCRVESATWDDAPTPMVVPPTVEQRLAAAYLLVRKRGDTIILDFLSKCRVESATWDDAPTPMVVPPTVEQRLAALESKGVTSTIPPGAVT
jgi:hypothetical protein